MIRKYTHIKDPPLIRDGEVERENVLLSRKGRSDAGFDALLWRGSTGASLTQRVGLGIFGICFVFVGATLLELARENSSAVHLIVGVVFCLFGARLIANSVRRASRK